MPGFLRLGAGVRSFKGWILGAVIWFLLSLVVIGEYLRTQSPVYLTEIWFLMSLMWFMFGFAGLFHTLRKERGRNLVVMLLITIIPPFLLHSLAFFLAFELARRGYIPPP